MSSAQRWSLGDLGYKLLALLGNRTGCKLRSRDVSPRAEYFKMWDRN